jgi:type VI secretion system protein ImpG
LQYLSVRALCSNRDLPLYLRRQFADAQYELTEAAPVAAIACVAGPSEPLASPVDGFDPWVALSHLFVNYLSLVDAGKERGADVLRSMLGLYATVPGHLLLRQSEGLLEVATQQVTRRVPGGGPLAFGRGVQISLTMNDRAFDGGSPFLLASVLEHFLAAHVAINSFVETRLVLSDRAEQITWPTRFGRRPTF